MKFTKEQLAEALKAKLTPNGKKLAMSERTLTGHVEKIYKRLEKADDESELDDAVAEYLPDFEDIDGNIRKDNADFIKAYKDKKDDVDKKDISGDGDSRLDEILKEIQELRDERALEKAKGEAERKRSAILVKFKEKGIKDDKWAQAYLKKLKIDSETDVDSETSDALALYNLQHTNIDIDINPGGTGGGTSDHADDDFIKEVAAGIKRDRRD